MGVSLPLVSVLSLIPIPAVVDTVPVVGSIRNFVGEAADLADGELIEDFRVQIADHYDVSDRIIDRVDGRPVHISPQNTNVAFAYPELGYWVLPTVQHYVSYTEELERRNVEALLGPEGPDFVLHQPTTDVEFHHPAWESPLLTHTLWCSFEPVEQEGRWSLLAPTGSTCDPPTPLGEPVPATVDRDDSVGRAQLPRHRHLPHLRRRPRRSGRPGPAGLPPAPTIRDDPG